jgi:predicted transcriptional regulator
MKGQIPLSDLIKAMADKNSLDLFDNIAINDLDSNELMEVLVLSKRQYFRIYDLRAAGLIERRKGRYGITSFGRIFLVSLKWLDKLVKGTGDYKQ